MGLTTRYKASEPLGTCYLKNLTGREIDMLKLMLKGVCRIECEKGRLKATYGPNSEPYPEFVQSRLFEYVEQR